MALKQLFTFVSVFTLNKDTGTLHFTILLWWYLIQSGFLTKSPWKNELTEQGEISLAVMEKGAVFFLFYVSVHFVFVSLFKRVRKTSMWDHAWLYVRCEGIRQWSQMLVHVENRGTDSWRHIEIGNIWGSLISEGYTVGAWWCVQKMNLARNRECDRLCKEVLFLQDTVKCPEVCKSPEPRQMCALS